MRRPDAGLPIVLLRSDLEKIGLVAMHEAQAKHFMWIGLTGLCGLRDDAWHKMRNAPFDQIMRKLLEAASALDEPQLQERLTEVEAERIVARNSRNQIVHGHWVIDKDDGKPILAEIKTSQHLRQSDIDKAVEETAELSRKAYSAFLEFIAVGRRGGLPFCEMVDDPAGL